MIGLIGRSTRAARASGIGVVRSNSGRARRQRLCARTHDAARRVRASAVGTASGAGCSARRRPRAWRGLGDDRLGRRGRASGSGTGSGSGSGTTSTRKPRESARRRTRSADGSSMLDEWLFTPILSSLESSTTTALSTPNSRASS